MGSPLNRRAREPCRIYKKSMHHTSPCLQVEQRSHASSSWRTRTRHIPSRGSGRSSFSHHLLPTEYEPNHIGRRVMCLRVGRNRAHLSSSDMYYTYYQGKCAGHSFQEFSPPQQGRARRAIGLFASPEPKNEAPLTTCSNRTVLAQGPRSNYQRRSSTSPRNTQRPGPQKGGELARRVEVSPPSLPPHAPVVPASSSKRGGNFVS